jgi:chorismate mutase
MDIESLRKKIDELDERLVALLNERAQCASEIGKLKSGQSMPIYEPRREEVIFNNVRRHNRGPLPDSDVVQVYERIIDVMRKIQRQEIATDAKPLSGASGPEEND